MIVAILIINVVATIYAIKHSTNKFWKFAPALLYVTLCVFQTVIVGSVYGFENLDKEIAQRNPVAMIAHFLRDMLMFCFGLWLIFYMQRKSSKKTADSESNQSSDETIEQ